MSREITLDFYVDDRSTLARKLRRIEKETGRPFVEQHPTETDGDEADIYEIVDVDSASLQATRGYVTGSVTVSQIFDPIEIEPSDRVLAVTYNW